MSRLFCMEGDPGGRFKKASEFLNPRTFKFSPLNKKHIFQCMGKIFWNSTQKKTQKHTKSYPYIEWYDFDTTLKFEELLDGFNNTRCFKRPLFSPRMPGQPVKLVTVKVFPGLHQISWL